jgi:uncharacterized membrane protein
MKEIPLHADVECADGHAGQSTSVIVDPKSLRVTHFVVKEKARPHTERLVPVDQVAETTADSIRLSCTVSEMAEIQPFVVTEYRQVEIPRYQDVTTVGPQRYSEVMTTPVERELVPEGELAVREGVEVEATDGPVGRVDELLMDPETGQITHLVMREGHLWGQKEVLLPLSVIDRTEKETVYLSLDKETVSTMLSMPARWRSEVADVELVVVTYDEMDTANQTVLAMTGLTEKEGKGVLNIAVLVKDEEGKTSVSESQDVDPKHGALFGAITGGLVGLLGGPIGVAVGAAAGAAAGGLAAGRIDMGFPDEYLEQLEEGLQPGSSALVILVDGETVDEVVERLAVFEGQILRQSLNDDLMAQLTSQADGQDNDADTQE